MVIRLFTILFAILSLTSCSSADFYTRDLVDEFSADLKKEGYLGSTTCLYPDINDAFFVYKTNKQMTVEEARGVLVTYVEDLVDRINKYSELRPYLYEYPFKSKYISLDFVFLDQDNKECSYPYVSRVSLMSNYFNGGRTNIVYFCFRNPETGQAMQPYCETFSESRDIYYGLYHQSETNNE